MNRGGRHERQRREPQSDRGVGGSRVAEGEGVCRDGGDADEERRHAVGGSGERAARHAKETRGVRALHAEGKEGGEEEEVRRTVQSHLNLDQRRVRKLREPKGARRVEQDRPARRPPTRGLRPHPPHQAGTEPRDCARRGARLGVCRRGGGVVGGRRRVRQGGAASARVDHRRDGERRSLRGEDLRVVESEQRDDGAGGEEGAQGPAAERVCELAEVAGGEVLADGVDREGDRERDHVEQRDEGEEQRDGEGVGELRRAHLARHRAEGGEARVEPHRPREE
mmetsp:Transcript_7401/g.21603  ORF Transcript_7401/g.21603 Transcript_7401/m.21603 type:complete len:281 (+) Transcript_7401:204-1046(+)